MMYIIAKIVMASYNKLFEKYQALEELNQSKEREFENYKLQQETHIKKINEDFEKENKERDKQSLDLVAKFKLQLEDKEQQIEEMKEKMEKQL